MNLFDSLHGFTKVFARRESWSPGHAVYITQIGAVNRIYGKPCNLNAPRLIYKIHTAQSKEIPDVLANDWVCISEIEILKTISPPKP